MGTDLSFNKEVLAVLFKKWDRQPLSATEQALLDDWLAESPSNEEALIAFEQENWADAELKNWERTNAEEIWNRSRTEMPVKPVHRVHFRYRWWAAAAVVLVLLSVAVYRWALQKQPEEIVIAKTLIEIENFLISNNKTLEEFDLPKPNYSLLIRFWKVKLF